MNMLASLKTLLFSTTSRGAAANPPAASGEGSDFAAMLSGSMVEGTPAEAVAAPPAQALPQADGQADSAIAPDLALTLDEAPARPPHDHVPPGLAIAVAAGKGEPDTMPPGLALGLVKHAAEPQAEAEAPVEATSSPPQVTDETAEAAPSTKASPRPKVEAAPEAPVAIGVDAAPVEAKPAPKKAKAGEAEPKDSAPAGAPVPQPVTQPIAAPTIAVDAAPVPTVKGEVPAMPPAPVARPIAAPAIANEPAPGPITEEPTAGQSVAATHTAPVTQTTVPLAQPSPTTQAPPAAMADPAPAAPGDTSTLVAGSDAKPQKSKPSQSPRPNADQDASIPQDSAAAPPILNGKPVKAEALALLQMVREQVAARQSGASPDRVGEQVSAAASVKDSQPAQVTGAAPIPSLAALPADMTPLAPTAAPATSPVAAPSAPVVDLSASIGAQVIDMGVSGQWIDGLARDIAGLSANGAQGRFQVNSGQLGTVQVDIRQGAEGAAVSLTVASEAAELALRQDSDRLKLDSALSAVRIAEVRIERAPVGETARSDMGSDTSQRQSSQQQQQQGSQNTSAWQNNGQNMGQSQGQGRWQSRENSGFGPKSSGDPAVLNHAEARQDAGIAGRARYA